MLQLTITHIVISGEIKINVNFIKKYVYYINNDKWILL